MKTFLVPLGAMLVLGACSQSAAPPAESVPTVAPASAPATAVASLEARFNPTAAVGGGANASNAISPEDLKLAFESVPQIDKLRITANSSPPGAKGPDVTSVSIIAQDSGGLLKGFDQAAKRGLGESLLAAAGSAWTKASVSLLVTDPSGVGGQIIGSRVPGGPNTVIVT
jgi:hypothetical protein